MTEEKDDLQRESLVKEERAIRKRIATFIALQTMFPGTNCTIEQSLTV